MWAGYNVIVGVVRCVLQWDWNTYLCGWRGVITAGRKVGNTVWKHHVPSYQECWHCHSQLNPACGIHFLQIVLDLDLWMQFENFKDTGVIESSIRINRAIRTIYVGRQFFEISGPDPGQSSDISPLCCEKSRSSLSFVRALFYSVNAQLQSGERAFPSVTKLSSFWLSASWHPISSTSLGAASTCHSFHTSWGSGSAKGQISSWWCAEVCSPLPTAPSADDFNQCLSHREGGLCPSLRELHQALGIGRMCQQLSFKLAWQIYPCCVTTDVSPVVAVPHNLWASDLLLWSHLAIPVPCTLWLLVLQIIRWSTKGENTECSQKMLLVRRRRGCVQGTTEMQDTTSAKVGDAAIAVSGSSRSTSATKDADT